jgi:alkanesulfonate monooxygenase SsuD/methylene tetrahydromethanopterin reductase-like flavin-dependent oxidoreductase (luciferase family)
MPPLLTATDLEEPEVAAEWADDPAVQEELRAVRERARRTGASAEETRLAIALVLSLSESRRKHEPP